MRNILKPLVLLFCFAGFQLPPVSAQTTTDQAQLKKLSSQLTNLQKELQSIRNKVNHSKNVSTLAKKKLLATADDIDSADHTYSDVQPAHPSVLKTPKTIGPVPAKNIPGPPNIPAPSPGDVVPVTADVQTRPIATGQDLLKFIGQQQTYMPFDLDVPGQAFVSTGPYVGVPVQYSGSNLIINSPSVNTDLQLLKIRKSIIKQLNLMGGMIYKEPYHSHLLLSGLVEAQLSFFKHDGKPHRSDIDVTNVSIDLFFMGPSDWLLGFIELMYDNVPPFQNSYRVFNSRVFVNKAFITIGDLAISPVYGTIGQFFVPFGTYSSLMLSDTLPKLLARTKARAIEIGFEQQSKSALFGSLYAFRGDSFASGKRKINNGGVNLGYKFNKGFVTGRVGGGAIISITDSAGMQLGNGFATHENLHHQVPAYDINGMFNFGTKVDLIFEYVSAMAPFNRKDMSYKGKRAKPWAFDTELACSFYILDKKPSSMGIGYDRSGEAVTLGVPLSRTFVVFNTSLWRNTLQSIEFRHDKNYAKSTRGNGPVSHHPSDRTCTAFTCHGFGKHDNALTVQFDYYF